MTSNGPPKNHMMVAEAVPLPRGWAGALPEEIYALGPDLLLCMPCYGRTDPGRFDLEEVMPTFEIQIDRRPGDYCTGHPHPHN